MADVCRIPRGNRYERSGEETARAINRYEERNELAEKLGVDFRTISNWENGVRKPDIDMLVIVADFFEVNTDFLLGKDD